MNERPLGVTILAWLAIIGGVIGLIGGVMSAIAAIGLLALGGAAAVGGGLVTGAAVGGGALFVLGIAIWLGVLGAFEVLFGAGALQLKPWAWTVGMVWCYVSVASNVISVIASRGSGIVGAVIGVAIAVFILGYLYLQEVKEAFGKSDRVSPSFLVPVTEMVGKLGIDSQSATRPPTPDPPAGTAR